LAELRISLLMRYLVFPGAQSAAFKQ